MAATHAASRPAGPLPTGRAGRVLALAVTMVAIALAWLVVIAPFRGWYADRAEALEQRRMLAQRMATLARTLPDLRGAATAAAATPVAGPPATRLLDGATDALAAATLQQLVQEMAGRVGASLASTETLPAMQAGAYRRIGLHISLSARWPVLIGLLREIGQAATSMLVDDLQVHMVGVMTTTQEAPLDAGFTILAFRASGATPDASSVTVAPAGR